jgi:hypothetical protein
MVRLVQQVQPDLKAPPETKVFQVPLAQKVTTAPLGPPALKALQVLKAQQA